MADLNRLCLCGNVGQDPEIKALPSGKLVANFSIATNEKWKDKTSGETQTRTEWTNVVVYNDRTCEFIEAYLQKGTRVYIEGKKVTRKWETSEGETRYSTECVINGFDGRIDIQSNAKDGTMKPAQKKHQEEKQNGYQPQANPADDEDLWDDDVPF